MWLVKGRMYFLESFFRNTLFMNNKNCARFVGSQADATYFRPYIELSLKSYYSFFKKVTKVGIINHDQNEFRNEIYGQQLNHIAIILVA